MKRLAWLMLMGLIAFAVFVGWLPEYSRPANVTAPASAPAPIAAGALKIPVVGVTPDLLVDTWLQSRDNGARVHQAIDIPAPLGAPVVAAMTGRIEKLFQSEAGGTTAYIRSADGRWLTYYAHLSGYVARLAEGQAIAIGQQIGFVGDSGNAGAGNTHLHFALHRMAPGERWYQGTPINPYPYLAGTLYPTMGPETP